MQLCSDADTVEAKLPCWVLLLKLLELTSCNAFGRARAEELGPAHAIARPRHNDDVSHHWVHAWGSDASCNYARGLSDESRAQQGANAPCAISQLIN